MATSLAIQPVAASFDDGASARLATSANSTRSASTSSMRRRASRERIAVSMPQPPPQPIQREGPAQRAGLGEAQPRRAGGGQRLLRAQQPRERTDQPLHRGAVELVLPAEVVVTRGQPLTPPAVRPEMMRCW